MEDSAKRYAVVTGANKGIGFTICKELASKGVIVVLTARDEKRGLEAIENLVDAEPCLSQNVIFHQLDVTDPASVTSLKEFVEARLGKLDILVNNAGIGGCILDAEALKASSMGYGQVTDFSKIATETYELANECLRINFYGAKRMVDAFIHLLHLSDSPRIVNLSATMGKLKFLPDGWAKKVLSNVETLTEDKLDQVIDKYLHDFNECSLEINGWPAHLSAYTVSKVVLNSYTRLLAMKHPSFCINCVCPGFVKTEMNHNMGFLTPEEGARGPVHLALLPEGGPSGRFFSQLEETSFEV